MLFERQFGSHKFSKFAKWNQPSDSQTLTETEEEADDDTPLLEREVPREQENWDSPCPCSHLGKTKAHPTLTMKGLSGSYQHTTKGNAHLVELPISKYTINCMHLQDGVFQSELVIRQNESQEGLQFFAVFLLESSSVPRGSRRDELLCLKVVNEALGTEEVLKIGLEFVEEVNVHEHGVTEIAFHGMRVDVASWEANPSGGRSSCDAFLFKDIAASAYDRIEVVFDLEKHVRLSTWDEWCNQFPRTYLKDSDGRMEIVKPESLTPTEKFFYKWAISRTIENLLAKYSDIHTDGEYDDFRMRLCDVKSCIKGIAKCPLITLDMIEEFMGKRYKLEDVKKLTELSSPSAQTDRLGLGGLRKGIELPTPATSEAHNSRRRWLYSFVLLSDHLACLDIILQANLDAEDFQSMFARG